MIKTMRKLLNSYRFLKTEKIKKNSIIFNGRKNYWPGGQNWQGGQNWPGGQN